MVVAGEGGDGLGVLAVGVGVGAVVVVAVGGELGVGAGRVVGGPDGVAGGSVAAIGGAGAVTTVRPPLPVVPGGTGPGAGGVGTTPVW